MAATPPDPLDDYMREWGLEIYISKFKEQAIDLETLQMLSENDVKELIPVIGHRAKLNSQIKMLKDLTTLSCQDTITMELISENQLAQPSEQYDSIIPLDIDYEIAQQTQDVQVQDTTIFRDTTCELYKILTSCNEGKSLLLKQRDGLLSNADRRRLCNLIISNELKNDPQTKISSARLYSLAYQIECTLLNTISFDDHLHCFEVQKSERERTVYTFQNALISHVLCHLNVSSSGLNYVTPRISL